MADEDQERFEDYLELERYIEELQAGRVAHPPANMTPERARIYNMAALFRSASPQTAEPHPDFVVSLHARLLAEIGDAERGVVRERPPLVQPAPRLQQEEQRQQPSPVVAKQPRKSRFVSRRSLLSGGAVAAASLVVGTTVGAALEHDGNNKKVSSSNTVTATPPPSPSAPNDLTQLDQTQLYPAATLAELSKGAKRFATDAVIGYVIVSDGEVGEPPKGEVIAMSAACTHLGCIIQWQDADRHFHCPCHTGVFTEYGHPINSTHTRYLRSLPRLKTHVRGDTVYVEVPASTKPTAHSTSTTSIQNDGDGVTGTTA